MAGSVFSIFYVYGRNLPEYSQLADYQPPTTTRIHAGDGKLITEFYIEPRVFVPISAIPKRVIDSFIAAEDGNFYTHIGIDPLAILRATITNIRNIGKDKRPVGASTITQQVAQIFLLDKEVALSRKIREAILSLRIERALSKDRILELYLNEIYLGYGSYGVAAASLNYFDKPLNQLTIAESAYLAALPKAPNNYHPIRRSEAALIRRNWVINRMFIEGYINDKEFNESTNARFEIRDRTATEIFHAAYFAEEVRRELVERYGTESLYGGGLSVRTTLNTYYQEIATQALRNGLESYDRRHGWRGPLARIEEIDINWPSELRKIPFPVGITSKRKLALVLSVEQERAKIGFANGTQSIVPIEGLLWARPWREGQNVGPVPNSVREVLDQGDVVLVEESESEIGMFSLFQIPDIEGALVAIDPHTGRVLAMVGGYNFEESQFNRAIQALRQPGSAFKPIVYAAALENGFTPATLVLDAPFVVDQGPGLPKWKPANYSQRFYGPSTLRLGLEKSRNLMTVRMAQYIGINEVTKYAERLNITEDMPEILSMALGAGETTLMKLTASYAMIVNGGHEIKPTLIDRIQDRHGQTIYKHDNRICPNCIQTEWASQSPPRAPDNRKRVLQDSTAYQLVSMMEGVIQRGTGRTIKELGKPLAGKTGTTNDSFDAWFLGFSPDLVVGVYVGFDQPRTMGPFEQGASAAAPIFKEFMKTVLQNKPSIPFRVPPSVRLVRINADSGQLAQQEDENIILEAFRPGTEPGIENTLILDDGFITDADARRRGRY